MNMWKNFLAVFGACALFVMLLGTAWDSAWEQRPAGTELASDLDTFITEFKVQLSDRLETEMHFGSLTTTNDNGLMFLGSARCFAQNAKPTELENTGGYDGASHVADELTVTEPNGTADQGKGRCWIDLDGPDDTAGTPDDMSLAYWDETLDDFVYQNAPDNTAAIGAQRFLFDPGKYNLVFNGSFEMTTGDGTDTDAVPAGWVIQGTTPTFDYTDAPVSEGAGLDLEITAAGAVNQGITQTLTLLKASTTYYAVVRAQPAVDGSDSCSLRTTGGSTNIAGSGNSQIASGAAYVTLSGTFSTDATPTAVVLILEADADLDVCSFDHVAVYEMSDDRRGLSQPGVMSFRATSADDNTDCDTTYTNCADLASVTVEAPGPGYIAQIEAWGTFVCDAAAVPKIRIYDNTNAVALHETMIWGAIAGGTYQARGTYLYTEPLTPNQAIELRVDGEYSATSGTCDTEMNIAGTGETLAEAHGIEVLLIPTR